ncbi:DUF5829 family protein [Streptomyces sp. NPDC058308]|uniref:DUF5829 family protein n=1 Tax=Streptomyces sp. NPDC058308 TaxID=3346440 RepID=UPI0036ECFA7D
MLPLRRKSRTLRVLVVALAAALVWMVQGSAHAAPADGDPPAPGRQLLFFNHAYGVLDRETADAIEHSAYLRDFANFQVRTTTGSDGQTWTGRYLMGRETYVELFGTGDLPGRDGEFGAGGMGVSVERAGDLATARQRLVDLGVTPADFLQTRDFGDGVPVPWFDGFFAIAADQYDSFGAWSMEYRPEYFADPRSKTEPASHPGDVGRERYLSDDYRKHLMRDVTSVRIAATPRDVDSTVPLLRAGGFDVRSLPGGGAVALRGGTTIRFDATPREDAGLREITFSLNRPVAHRHEERIGRSTLTVGPGAGAKWAFDRAR